MPFTDRGGKKVFIFIHLNEVGGVDHVVMHVQTAMAESNKPENKPDKVTPIFEYVAGTSSVDVSA